MSKGSHQFGIVQTACLKKILLKIFIMTQSSETPEHPNYTFIMNMLFCSRFNLMLLL